MDKPGREIPKEYREIVEHLVVSQGWRYRKGGKHSMVFPADKARPGLAVPGTPGSQRSLTNFIGEVRKRGGVWPPPGRKGQ